jgi:hypothetical protein
MISSSSSSGERNRKSWDQQDQHHQGSHGYLRAVESDIQYASHGKDDSPDSFVDEGMMQRRTAIGTNLPGMLKSMNALDDIHVNMQRLAEGLSKDYRSLPSDSLRASGSMAGIRDADSATETETRTGRATGKNIRFTADYHANSTTDRPSKSDGDYLSQHNNQDFFSNDPNFRSSINYPPSSDDGASASLKSSIEGASQSVQSLKTAAAKYGVF